MTLFHSISYWRQYYRSYPAMILESPRGQQLLLKRDDDEVPGVWRLKGVIE